MCKDITQMNTFFIDVETNDNKGDSEILQFGAIHHLTNEPFHMKKIRPTKWENFYIDPVAGKKNGFTVDEFLTEN